MTRAVGGNKGRFHMSIIRPSTDESSLMLSHATPQLPTTTMTALRDVLRLPTG